MWHNPLPRAVLALVVGVALIVWKGGAVMTGLRAGSVQTVGGVMVSCEAGSSLRGNTPVHRVYPVYTYDVAGSSYEGGRYGWFSDRVSSREAAVEFARRHGAGTAVTVYYDPASPSRSALTEPQLGAGIAIWGAAMVAPFVVAGWYGLAAWRSRSAE